MNSLPRLFIGIFVVFLFAWGGLVAMPYLQLGGLQPQVDEDGNQFPPQRDSLAEYGAEVYAANGCMYCHSQQIRPEYAGSDLERGWGARRTVPRDYVNDRPVFLGTMRTGPDLTNIGKRQPSALWHHQHLFAPRAMAGDWSIMPAYRFLYKVQKVKGTPHPDGFTVPGDPSVPEGYEIVPTKEAKALVAYLISLDRSYSLKEAPVD